MATSRGAPDTTARDVDLIVAGVTVMAIATATATATAMARGTELIVAGAAAMAIVMATGRDVISEGDGTDKRSKTAA